MQETKKNIKSRPRSSVYHKIYCEAHGLSCIPEGYLIHHVDEDPWNNDIDNLQMLTFAEHNTIHKTGKTTTKGMKWSEETKEKIRKGNLKKHAGDKNGNYRKIEKEMIEDILNNISVKRFKIKYTCHYRKYRECKNNLEYYKQKFNLN